MKKRLLSFMLAVVMVISLSATQGVEAKGKKTMKLSSKSITVVTGNTNKVSIKNVGKISKKQIKAIKWSAGKNVKVKVKGKKRTTCVLTGVKKGKTTLKVKVKGKTLKCKVVVVEPKASSTAKDDNEASTESSKKDDKKNSSTDKKNGNNKNNSSDNKSNTTKDDTKHVHKYSDWSEVAPTCTEDGYKTRKCSGCGEVEKVATGKEKLGHNEERTTKVAATCTAGGTDLVTCKRCKSVLGEEPTKELGHNWSDWSTKEATCTEDGLKSRNCTRCNETQKEILKAKGHVDGEKKVVQATCTSEGYTEVFCAVCKKSIRKENVVKAYNHRETNTAITTVASWYNDGIKETRCRFCNKLMSSKTYKFNPVTAPSLTQSKITSNVASTLKNTIDNPGISFFAYYNLNDARKYGAGDPMFTTRIQYSESSGKVPEDLMIVGVLRSNQCDLFATYTLSSRSDGMSNFIFNHISSVDVDKVIDTESNYLISSGKVSFNIGDNCFIDGTNLNKILAKTKLSYAGVNSNGAEFSIKNTIVSLNMPASYVTLKGINSIVSSSTIRTRLTNYGINPESDRFVRMGFMPKQGVYPENLN